MRGRRVRFWHLQALAAGFLIVEAICIAVSYAYGWGFAEEVKVAPVWVAVFLCFRQATLVARKMRVQWYLFSAGILLWATAFSVSDWLTLFGAGAMVPAGIHDLIYFLYGVPVLLAISSPTEGPRSALFFWLDAIQVVVAFCLIYVLLFNILPFSYQMREPISTDLLAKTYSLENILLAGFVTLRLWGRDPSLERRRFYLIVAGFLWSYLICATWYNHMILVTQGYPYLWILLSSVPFLMLAVSIVPAVPREADAAGSSDNLMTLFIDYACPILYTSALLALGLAVTRAHFVLGVVSIVMALAIYGLRSIVQQNELIRTREELRVARDQLEVISLHDGLTRVANRRSFDQTLDVEWNRAMRLGHPLSLLLIDIDYFKMFNDRFGHRAGDRCLTEVAGALRSALIRGSDLLARYGGEEFAAILVDADRDGAERVAGRMQAQVEALQIPTETPLGYVSISIGVATWGAGEDGTAEGLIEASDRALYQAKRGGRNRIEYGPLQSTARRAD